MNGPSGSDSPPNPPPPAPYAPASGYPWYPAPPKKDTVPIILAIVIAIVIVAVVLSATLVGFFGLAGSSDGGPSAFYLGPVDQANGNASVSMWTWGPRDPSSVLFAIEVNDLTSPDTSIPQPDDFAAVVLGGHALRVYWFDPNDDGFLGTDDVFWITGDRAPLPSATTFRFTLRGIGGPPDATVTTVTWTTGPG